MRMRVIFQIAKINSFAFARRSYLCANFGAMVMKRN